MKRSEVQQFIESGVEDLNSGIGFGTGRITEFNKERSNEYPFAWLESLSVSPEITESGLTIDSWDINLHICKLDKLDSSADQYEAIINDCDEVAQKLMHRYNNVVEGFGLVTISGYSRTPFIKQHADVLTGIILSFTLTAPDKTNLC
jgi:hypothetical protein